MIERFFAIIGGVLVVAILLGIALNAYVNKGGRGRRGRY
jgi:Tfp pilus assembly protein PilE